MTFGAHSRFGMVASADGAATQAGTTAVRLGRARGRNPLRQC